MIIPLTLLGRFRNIDEVHCDAHAPLFFAHDEVDWTTLTHELELELIQTHMA